MSRYDALTAKLLATADPVVVLSFDELDSIVGELPHSAKTYGAWWANNRSSQPHARAWLDAGRRVSPKFDARVAVFTLDESLAHFDHAQPGTTEGQEVLAEYVESTISLERDLEDHLVANLGSLEAGLTLGARQETTDVGRVDIIARAGDGQRVIIELKAGEARDAAIGQIARYIGWYTRSDGKPPRAYLIAGSFPEPVKYAAGAIPSLRLITYRVSFAFNEVSVAGIS
jgi:hypothetical protein